MLVGGMHRSGTSLTASLVASAGIDLGPELLGANASNPLGHFEDLGIQSFHCRALAARGVSDEGYTATAHGEVPPALEPVADELIAERMRPGVAWGWKEPRTTLFLDFWQERLPQARHLFVFRRPWEVADSLFRRGDETFVTNPTFAFDVWTHYNRQILDFVRRHRSRCAIFEVSQVIADPVRVFATVRSQLDVPLGRPDRCYRDDHFHRDEGANRAALVRAVAPDAWGVYLELRELAGIDERVDIPPQRLPSLADCAVLEWARASRAEMEARRLAAAQAAAAPVAAVTRRKSRSMWAGIVSASRRLVASRKREAPADTPALLPFPALGPARRVGRAA